MKVRLRPAYAWTCEECGRDNFAAGVVPEFSEEEIAELREQHGVEDYVTGDFVEMPTSVVCQHCGEKFETEHYSE